VGDISIFVQAFTLLSPQQLCHIIIVAVSKIGYEAIDYIWLR
jgi:hypothetical protein